MPPASRTLGRSDFILLGICLALATAALGLPDRTRDPLADSARRVRRKHRRDSLTAVADSALARGDTARADSIRVLLQPRKRVVPDTTKPVTP